MAHLGFILHAYERNPQAAAPLLTRALAGDNEEILNDKRFYYQAGDALYRTGQKDQV